MPKVKKMVAGNIRWSAASLNCSSRTSSLNFPHWRLPPEVPASLSGRVELQVDKKKIKPRRRVSLGVRKTRWDETTCCFGSGAYSENVVGAVTATACGHPTDSLSRTCWPFYITSPATTKESPSLSLSFPFFHSLFPPTFHLSFRLSVLLSTFLLLLLSFLAFKKYEKLQTNLTWASGFNIEKMGVKESESALLRTKCKSCGSK